MPIIAMESVGLEGSVIAVGRLVVLGDGDGVGDGQKSLVSESEGFGSDESVNPAEA